MSNLVTAIFKHPSDAAMAVNELELKGIAHSDISLVASENTKAENFGVSEATKLPEGAALGALSGGALTALVAGFTAVGSIASGGLGLIATGPIVAALAGAGAGAAAGSVIGAAIGATIPEHEVKFYEEAIKEGSVLVGVKYTDDKKDLIEKTLKAHSAQKVAA